MNRWTVTRGCDESVVQETPAHWTSLLASKLHILSPRSSHAARGSHICYRVCRLSPTGGWSPIGVCFTTHTILNALLAPYLYPHRALTALSSLCSQAIRCLPRVTLTEVRNLSLPPALSCDRLAEHPYRPCCSTPLLTLLFHTPAGHVVAHTPAHTPVART